MYSHSILRYKLFKYVYQAHVRDVYKGGTNIHTSTYAIIILLYTPSILRDKLFKDVYQELKIMLNNVRLRIKMNQIIKLPFLNHILLLWILLYLSIYLRKLKVKLKKYKYILSGYYKIIIILKKKFFSNALYFRMEGVSCLKK